MDAFYAAQQPAAAAAASQPAAAAASRPPPRQQQQQARAQPKRAKPSSHSSGPRIATFGSMAADAAGEEKKGGEQYYAGGSEGSGMAVQGRPDPRGVYDAARAAGATEAYDGSEAAAAASTARWGSGRTLGDTDTPSAAIAGPAAAAAAAESGMAECKLVFWKDGFTVDGGPLRKPAENPADKEFMDCIMKGQVPPEIGRDVHVALEDKRSEEYVAPPKVHHSFSGQGRRLGDVVPDVVAAAVAAPSAAVAAGGGSSAAAAPVPKVAVDESQPFTKVQLRLIDGTRMRAQFNLSHTIADIRAFVDAATPAGGGRAYVLMTTFPNKVLDDLTMTVETAKLKNAQIVQKPL